MLNISKVDLAYVWWRNGSTFEGLWDKIGFIYKCNTCIYIYYLSLSIYIYTCISVCVSGTNMKNIRVPWILNLNLIQLYDNMSPAEGFRCIWMSTRERRYISMSWPLDHETQDFRIRYTTKYNTMSRRNGLMIPICLKEEAKRPIWSVVDVLRIFLLVSSTS